MSAYGSPNTEPLGLPAALARGVNSADIINAVEQTSGGDSLISFGRVNILYTGDLGRVHEDGTVRLTPAEREELITRLMDHRFADMAAGFGEGGGGR